MSSFVNLEPVQTLRLKLWLLKKLISLPPAVLRSFSGGVAQHIQGRTLDAQMQFLGRTFFNHSGYPPMRIATRTIEQARQEWADMVALLGVPARLNVSITSVHGEVSASSFGGIAPVSGLLIKPGHVDASAPLMIFFHQGGGIIGGPEVSKTLAALIADGLKCPVFVPEYRLAPTHRFPAALEDAHAAIDWAMAQGAPLGARSDQIIIAGVLTGANLALRTCLDRRRDFKPLPKHMTLITPLIDLSDPGVRTSPFAATWPISGADIDTMIAHYAGADTSLSAPQLSPLRDTMFKGLPPALIVAAGFDPIAPQAVKLVERLLEASVKTQFAQYETLPLGFDLFVDLVDEAYLAAQDMVRRIKSAII